MESFVDEVGPACVVLVEADAIDGVDCCGDLEEAGHDLELRLNPNTRDEDVKTAHEDIDTAHEVVASPTRLNASERETQEERSPYGGNDGAGEDAEPLTRRRADGAAPLCAIKVMRVTHAPRAKWACMARVAALAGSSAARG